MKNSHNIWLKLDKHQRLLCYDFKLEDNDSIAHVYFYDNKKQHLQASNRLY